jgi:hypothetical protein
MEGVVMDSIKPFLWILVAFGLVIGCTSICQADCGPVKRHPEEKELTIQIFEALVEDAI